MTLDVTRVEDLCMGGLCTKAIPCLVSKVDEVLTPDLDGRVAILGAVSRVEGKDPGRLVVLEESLIDAVIEIASHRDLDRHSLGSR